jgi:putative phosphonate metabolism protein
MTETAPRYALYYAPAADSALWRFGSATLGYDAVTGADIDFAVPPGCESLDWPEITAEPRRYGFHATLKAPFELANGRNEGALRAFARNYAAGRPPVRLTGLSVSALGRFIALTPSEPSEALQRFAFDIVQAFEPFRAPLSEADLARRLQSPLTPAHRAYLEAYGYPYVGDAFRFHMTLTGSLPDEQVAPVKAALTEAHAQAVPAGPVQIDRVAIFRQASRSSRFVLLDSIPLG